MALFHGEGTEPGLGRREMRSRRLQVPVEGKEAPPQPGPTQARALPACTVGRMLQTPSKP